MIIQKDKISLSASDLDASGIAAFSANNAPMTKTNAASETYGVERGTSVNLNGDMVYTQEWAKQQNTETNGMSKDSSMSVSDFISQCMTGEDAMDLSGEDTPLDEYTSSQLERAIHRVKEQRRNTQESVESQVKKEQQQEEHLENGAVEGQIRESLERSCLPVETDLVNLVSRAVDLVQSRDQLSLASMKFFIESEWQITPENINNSVYGTKQVDIEEADEPPAFEEVAAQVEEILEQGGLASSDENMEQAKWLYENQLPVTAENVQMLNRLAEVKDLDLSKVIKRIVDELADGIAPDQANLAIPSRDEIRPKVDAVNARLQLEETRLVMTVDAARRMEAKGISVDVENVEKVVEALKQQNEEQEDLFLEEKGISLSPNEKAVYRSVVQNARSVMESPVQLLGDTFAQRKEISFGALAERGVVLKAEYQKMEQTYEAVGTQVRSDLGDSMTKAFSNVDTLLREIGLETTALNQRAVRILGANRMEISPENVEEMKVYDKTVTRVMAGLKPAVVADMIEKNVNPLDMTMDELQAYVDRASEAAAGTEESFRRFLWQLDRNGDFTDEQRQGMIGVFRLMHQVEKSQGALVGQVVKEGKEITLSSLLSASRSRRARGLDVEISEDFGALEQTKEHGTAIDQQINGAFYTTLAKEVQERVTPEDLVDLVDKQEDVSLESLWELATETEGDSELLSYYQEETQKIRHIMEETGDSLDEFFQALEMPDTYMNRTALAQYLALDNKAYLSLFAKEEQDEILQAFEDPERLQECYQQIDEEHQKQLEKQEDRADITYEDVVTLSQMAGSISFYHRMRKSNVYEIPIITEQGVGSCRVTLNQQQEKKGTVDISMETPAFGKLQATFRVQGTHVKGFITMEQTQQEDRCRQCLLDFEETLEENGYTMDSDNLVQGSRHSFHVGEAPMEVSNKDLYFIAKCFIENMIREDE